MPKGQKSRAEYFMSTIKCRGHFFFFHDPFRSRKRGFELRRCPRTNEDKGTTKEK